VEQTVVGTDAPGLATPQTVAGLGKDPPAVMNGWTGGQNRENGTGGEGSVGRAPVFAGLRVLQSGLVKGGHGGQRGPGTR